MSVVLILLICALICFLLATGGFPTGISLGWLGLFFITLTMIISGHTGL